MDGDFSRQPRRSSAAIHIAQKAALEKGRLSAQCDGFHNIIAILENTNRRLPPHPAAPIYPTL